MIWKEVSPDHESILELGIKRPILAHTSQTLTTNTLSCISVIVLAQLAYHWNTTLLLFSSPNLTDYLHITHLHSTPYLTLNSITFIHIYKIDHQSLNQVGLNQNKPYWPKTHKLIHSRRKRRPKHIIQRSYHWSTITKT